MRIGIVGSAGTGKSTLAIEISKRLDIPFLASKDITLEILNNDGYIHGCGIQVEKFLAQECRQDTILKKTISTQRKEEKFVTDRTVVDLAAYAIAELHCSDPKKVSLIIDKCKKEVGVYTHLIVCPWGLTPLRGNNKRTLNPWYQFIIHSLGLSFLNQCCLDYYMLKFTGEKERLEESMEYLNK